MFLRMLYVIRNEQADRSASLRLCLANGTHAVLFSGLTLGTFCMGLPCLTICRQSDAGLEVQGAEITSKEMAQMRDDLAQQSPEGTGHARVSTFFRSSMSLVRDVKKVGNKCIYGL